MGLRSVFWRTDFRNFPRSWLGRAEESSHGMPFIFLLSKTSLKNIGGGGGRCFLRSFQFFDFLDFGSGDSGLKLLCVTGGHAIDYVE